MSIRVPTDIPFSQPNEGDTKGSLWATFNCDLDSNPGKLRITRSRMVTNTASVSTFGFPFSFKYYNDTGGARQILFALAGSRMHLGGSDANTAFADDTENSIAPILDSRYDDMEVFNDKLYVFSSDALNKYESSASVAPTWTINLIASLASAQIRSPISYADKLFFVNAPAKIYAMTTGESSSLALDLGNPLQNQITWMRAGTNKIWIGTINYTGSKSYVYEWDGNSTQATRKYKLNAPGSVACVIKDDIPHIVDTNGKLLEFNGSAFVEIAKLPNNGKFPLMNALSKKNNRFMHYNGIGLEDGNIVMNVCGTYMDTDGTMIENFPSGVYKYIPGIGLIHKYSVSSQSVNSSTLTDYGQVRISQAGALIETSIYDTSATTVPATRNGSILFGAKYFTDATTTTNGAFCSDTLDSVQKAGYFITTKAGASSIEDIWNNFFIKHKKFLSATDKIILKYRTEEVSSSEFTATFTTTDSFTSTDDWSDYAVGDEVEIMNGSNAGLCAHITALSSSAGTTTITVDEDLIPAGGTTAKVRVQKWKKINQDITGTTSTWNQLLCGAESSWIQVKVYMVWTGKNEFEELEITNKAKQQAI